MSFDMPFVHQASQVLCWEAAARMMWLWKYGKSQDARYSAVVDQFKQVNAGMDWNSLDFNIFRPLGIKGKKHAASADLRRELPFTPVATTLDFIPSNPGVNLPHGSGHAVVILELDGKTNSYLVVDPMTSPVRGKKNCRSYAIPLFTRVINQKMGSYVWYWESGPY